MMVDKTGADGVFDFDVTYTPEICVIIRPGAGTLLGLIVIVSMLARVLHSGMTSVDLSSALEGMCASSTAFVGSVLAVNRHSSNAE
jgi:hypothetical protein